MTVPDNANLGGSAAPPNQPAQTSVDTSQYEAELARLRQENFDLQRGYQELRPYADDITWLTQDPANVELVRETRQAYENARKSRQQVPEGMEPLAKDIHDVKSFVEEFKQQQQYASQEPLRKFVQEGEAYLNAKAKEHPEIKNSLMQIGAQLSVLCRPQQFGGAGMTLDEGWARVSPGWVEAKSSGPPPSSMRADSGMPGLPPPFRPPASTPAGEGKKLGQIVLERMQSMS
jgi:hypothetical protein